MFSVEKSTPAGKKYASAAGGAGENLQLCCRAMLYSTDSYFFVFVIICHFVFHDKYENTQQGNLLGGYQLHLTMFTMLTKETIVLTTLLIANARS